MKSQLFNAILVTGGAGFIGARVVHQLVQKFPQARIDIFDKLTYAAELKRLSGLLGPGAGRVHLIEGDVAHAASLKAALSRGYDGVVHVAAETHVDRSIDAPETFVQTNIQGTFHLLEALVGGAYGKLLLVSTDEVYGDGADEGGQGAMPHLGLKGSSPYAASKAAGDLLALSYHRTYGANLCITRASNAFGPYQFPEKLLPLALSRVLAGAKIPLYGDGEQARDWLHVDDHASGIVAALEYGQAGEIFHLCTGVLRSNRQVLQRLLAKVRAAGLLVPHDIFEPVADRPGHDRHYAISAEAAFRPPHWQPAIPFEAGLEALAQWALGHQDWLLKHANIRPDWLNQGPSGGS